MGMAHTVCDRCRGSLGGGDAAAVAGRKHNGGIAPEEGCRIAERALLIVMGLTAGGSLTFYTFTTYMQKYLVNASSAAWRRLNFLERFVLARLLEWRLQVSAP